MACFIYRQYLARPGNRQYCSAEPLAVSLPEAETWLSAADMKDHAPCLAEAYWKAHGSKPGCVLRVPNEPIKWPCIFGCTDRLYEIRHYMICPILWQLGREALSISEHHFA